MDYTWPVYDLLVGIHHGMLYPVDSLRLLRMQHGNDMDQMICACGTGYRTHLLMELIAMYVLYCLKLIHRYPSQGIEL